MGLSGQTVDAIGRIDGTLSSSARKLLIWLRADWRRVCAHIGMWWTPSPP